MDETIEGIIQKITIKFDKPTAIKGGHKCTTFFDCAQLSPNDLARLAVQATGHLDEDHFNAVVGIAYSGILFAAAVAGGRLVNIYQKDGELYGPSLKGKRVIVVDDVVATGAHLEKTALAVAKSGAKVVGFACAVDRSNGVVGSADMPLYSSHQAVL